MISREEINQIRDEIKEKGSLWEGYRADQIVEHANSVGKFLAEKKCSRPYLMAFLDIINRCERACVAETLRLSSDAPADMKYMDTLIFLEPRLEYRQSKASGEERKAYEVLRDIHAALLTVLRKTISRLEEAEQNQRERFIKELRESMYKFREFYQAVFAIFKTHSEM